MSQLPSFADYTITVLLLQNVATVYEVSHNDGPCANIEIAKPWKYLCFGRQMNALLPFNPRSFVPLSSPHHNRSHRLHRYNPILDLERFRFMVTEGRIPADNFVTIQAGRRQKENKTKRLKTEDDVIKFFKHYIHAQASSALRRYVQ